MNTSIYTVVSVLGLILILNQIIHSILIVDKINDLIIDTYNKERNTRLYGEILGLKNNVKDAYNYIVRSIPQKNSNLVREDRNRYLLESYLERIDEFLDRNEDFRNLSIDALHWYRVEEHKQKNPALDSIYPNWYFRFSKRG